jgi:hypothetical protein
MLSRQVFYLNISYIKGKHFTLDFIIVKQKLLPLQSPYLATWWKGPTLIYTQILDEVYYGIDLCLGMKKKAHMAWHGMAYC